MQATKKNIGTHFLSKAPMQNLKFKHFKIFALKCTGKINTICWSFFIITRSFLKCPSNVGPLKGIRKMNFNKTHINEVRMQLRPKAGRSAKFFYDVETDLVRSINQSFYLQYDLYKRDVITNLHNHPLRPVMVINAVPTSVQSRT